MVVDAEARLPAPEEPDAVATEALRARHTLVLLAAVLHVPPLHVAQLQAHLNQ